MHAVWVLPHDTAVTCFVHLGLDLGMGIGLRLRLGLGLGLGLGLDDLLRPRDALEPGMLLGSGGPALACTFVCED